MAKTIRKVLTWILLSCIAVMAIAVLGEFFIEVARDKGWYDDAGNRWDSAVGVVRDTVTSAIVLYPLVGLGGVVSGLWLHWFATGIDRRRNPPADSAGNISSMQLQNSIGNAALPKSDVRKAVERFGVMYLWPAFMQLTKVGSDIATVYCAVYKDHIEVDFVHHAMGRIHNENHAIITMITRPEKFATVSEGKLVPVLMQAIAAYMDTANYRFKAIEYVKRTGYVAEAGTISAIRALIAEHRRLMHGLHELNNQHEIYSRFRTDIEQRIEKINNMETVLESIISPPPVPTLPQSPLDTAKERQQ